MEKRNVQRGCAFGYSFLTWKTRDCPRQNTEKFWIEVIFGRLGGGDNPTFYTFLNLCEMSGKPYLQGFSAFFILLDIYMCVRDTFCGAWRVRRACGVSVRRGGRVRRWCSGCVCRRAEGETACVQSRFRRHIVCSRHACRSPAHA